MPAIKKRVFDEMAAQNVKPTALARRAHLKPSTIHRLGSHDHKIETLEAIAVALGRDLEWLTGKEKRPAPEGTGPEVALTEASMQRLAELVAEAMTERLLGRIAEAQLLDELRRRAQDDPEGGPPPAEPPPDSR